MLLNTRRVEPVGLKLTARTVPIRSLIISGYIKGFFLDSVIPSRFSSGIPPHPLRFRSLLPAPTPFGNKTGRLRAERKNARFRRRFADKTGENRDPAVSRRPHVRSLRCIRVQGPECGTETSFLPPNRREAPRNGTENRAGQYPAGSISATVRQAPPPLLQGNRAPRYSFLSPNRSTSPRSMRRNIVASSATTGEIRPITSSM